MDIRVPHLADGVESGTVVNILVKVGDQVQKDQALLELETDKAVAAIPATQAGTVTNIKVKKDDKVAVGQVIATISESGAAPAAASNGNGHTQQAVTDDVESPSVAQREAVARESFRPQAPRQAAPASQSFQRRPAPAGIPEPASPTVRKVAHELGIDLTRVHGSQHGGRIVMDDLRAYIQDLQRLADSGAVPAAPQAAPAGAPSAPVVELPDFSKWGQIDVKPMSTLRKKIAEKMSESARTVARVTQFDDVDITDLMSLKKKHEAGYEKAGTRLTMTAFAVKVVVDALKKHPAFNATIDVANEKIIYKSYYHIAMAVDTEQGLIVPVIKDADKKSLLQIAKEIDRLALATRERKIAVDDLQGGTFTISNQGSLGGTHFTPVVYTPQVAILGLGRAKWTPVVREGKIATRLIMPMTLAYDHRLVDGGNAVRFNNELVGGFQKFDESFISLGKPAPAAKPQLKKKAKKKK